MVNSLSNRSLVYATIYIFPIVDFFQDLLSIYERQGDAQIYNFSRYYLVESCELGKVKNQ